MPSIELAAGLYSDFGYNGFDFWPEATWTGTRCLEDVDEGTWTTYGFEKPIELAEPGLV